MISKSFLKSSFIFTLGGAMPMAASIILLPFYTNMLSEIQYTQVLFYVSITLLFQILFSYSLESYFGIEYTRLYEDPVKQKRFIGTTSLLLLIIGAALLFVLALSGDFLFKHIFKKEFEIEFWPYGFYSVLTAFFNSYFKAASIALIYLKRPKTFILSNLINFFATLIISIGGLYVFPDTIIGPIYGRLLSGAVIFLIGQYIFSSAGTLVFEKSFLKELQQFCTPFMIVVLSGWVLSQIDRYFLQSYIETIDLNAYDLMLKCFFGIEFIQNSLSAVIFPKLYEIWAKDKTNTTTKESNRYFNVFTAINIIQLIVFCIVIPWVYKLFIKKEGFDHAEEYIGILAAGYSLRGIMNFYISTILYTKKTLIMLKIYGISALIEIVITYYAVKFYGLIGAIYAGLFIKILLVLFSVLFTKNIFKYEFNYFKLMFIPFIYIIINVIQFHFIKQYSLLFYIGQLILFGSILYFIFRNEIKLVIQQYTKK